MKHGLESLWGLGCLDSPSKSLKAAYTQTLNPKPLNPKPPRALMASMGVLRVFFFFISFCAAPGCNVLLLVLISMNNQFPDSTHLMGLYEPPKRNYYGASR